MSQQRHIIKRQTIELQISRPAEAQRLQAEISRVYRQRIVPLIDSYCTRLGSPDKIYRIDTLELDLGNIDPGQLEHELVDKIGQLFEQRLSQEIAEQERQAQSPQRQSQLELLAIFARSGNLPWWADTARPQLLAESVEYLRQEAPLALQQLLQSLVGEEAPLRRLVNHFDDALLAGLASVLVGPEDDSLAQNIRQLVAALPTTRGASRRSSVWGRILQVSGYAAEAFAGPESFYRMMLSAVAAELGMSLPDLVVEVQRQLPAGSRLRPIVEALSRETEVSPAAQTLARRLRDMPAGTGASSGLWRALYQLIPQLTAAARAELLTILDDVAPAEQADSIRRLLQSSITSRQLPAAAVAPWLAELAQAGVTLTVPQPALREVEPDPGFSDVDALYVDNAGLVVLWPFLTNFFDHLGLLQDKQFQDAAAQQRAVGLLQFLATGQDIFPEYLLPLNKVLCGLEPDELFDFGPAITEAEMAECQDLLGAAIAQAAILKEMSISGFQGTFLLRSGVLRGRDGAWLLQVERESYDVVLDRFPWSWSWLRLPWMGAPLRVEW